MKSGSQKQLKHYFKNFKILSVLTVMLLPIMQYYSGLPLIRSERILWLFPDFWTIFTDLKLARWMIKNTENHWSKLLFLQTSLKSIIFHDAFLTENIIPWLFTDFHKLLRFSLTFYKIPWLFPDVKKILLFPDRGNPVIPGRLYIKLDKWLALKLIQVCVHLLVQTNSPE